VGQTKFPPTYDITALLEYGTSQVWTNHVCFDVSLLELHKDVTWCTSQQINDVVTITNVGAITATGLTFTQTFPQDIPNKIFLNPDWIDACISIRGGRTIGPVLVNAAGLYSGVSNPSVYTFAAPFDHLDPGETMTILMYINVYYGLPSIKNEAIVFDSMVGANEIPPWKSPIGLAAIYVPMGYTGTGSTTYLWQGLELTGSNPNADFDIYYVFPVVGTFIRMQLQHVLPVMTLDPVPVPLIAGENGVTAADVALVQKAVVGLAPYDVRMDCNGNGRIDLEDLKLFELAVS